MVASLISITIIIKTIQTQYTVRWSGFTHPVNLLQCIEKLVTRVYLNLCTPFSVSTWYFQGSNFTYGRHYVLPGNWAPMILYECLKSFSSGTIWSRYSRNIFLHEINILFRCSNAILDILLYSAHLSFCFIRIVAHVVLETRQFTFSWIQ